uniref:Uncharacterized protein n=1 Tax=Tanacetum cinerariifolium TaxID=118510 RepID=A0A6L2N0H9_TANCI|nr:hypothetical protein [Tanacetum cinerariifolium]
MSINPRKHTRATKLRKKSVIKQTGGDVKAKALWKTVVSVIANNLGFLVLVLFLAYIVRHIAKVKKILKLHVDRNLKLGSKRVTKRVRDESGKLGKRMDDESGKFNERFRETDAKIRILEGVLNGIQWLTKEEFDKFVEEFKGWKGREIGLDEIRAFAKGVVKKEIEKLAKGVVDNEIEKNTTKALWITVVSLISLWRGYWCLRTGWLRSSLGDMRWMVRES